MDPGPGGQGGGPGSGGQSSKTRSSLFLRSIWFWVTASTREVTLLLTASTSWGPAQGFVPGRVPRIYCSFSPSALRMWLRASSSMAMEAMIMVRASSRVMSAPLGGKEGIDIIKSSIARPGGAGAEIRGRLRVPLLYPMMAGALPFHRAPPEGGPMGWPMAPDGEAPARRVPFFRARGSIAAPPEGRRDGPAAHSRAKGLFAGRNGRIICLSG